MEPKSAATEKPVTFAELALKTLTWPWDSEEKLDPELDLADFQIVTAWQLQFVGNEIPEEFKLPLAEALFETGTNQIGMAYCEPFLRAMAALLGDSQIIREVNEAIGDFNMNECTYEILKEGHGPMILARLREQAAVNA